MSDTTMRAGPPADRKTTTTGMAASGGALALITGGADWAFLQCYAGGHWHYVAPSQTLIEMAAPIILLPVALWFAKVFSLLGDIITNKLEKDDSK